ncbi:MAG: hypothetical protein NT151_08170 [Acidobacteria bacterium]|nr:hypothetical protein [Acidobacteriota bacterium]
MKYKGVTRVITIFINKVVGQRYAIDVAPDPAEVVVGDKIVWHVQNAPHGIKVSVGNFRRLEPAPDVLLRADKAPLVRERTFNPAAPSGLIHQAKKADIGYYKYDVLFDGQTVLDPEIEVRGPKV